MGQVSLFEIIIFAMVICSVAGLVALCQIIGHPPHVWSQMGLTPNRRSTLIVLLVPVLGPINLVAALYYWNKYGARAAAIETDRNIS